jgi:hypothetical protein
LDAGDPVQIGIKRRHCGQTRLEAVRGEIGIGEVESRIGAIERARPRQDRSFRHDEPVGFEQTGDAVGSDRSFPAETAQRPSS